MDFFFFFIRDLKFLSPAVVALPVQELQFLVLVNVSHSPDTIKYLVIDFLNFPSYSWDYLNKHCNKSDIFPNNGVFPEERQIQNIQISGIPPLYRFDQFTRLS